MYHQHIILYGSLAAQEMARNLLQNLEAVKREESLHNGSEIRLTLDQPLKETSLISLLRQSGIHGFRLVEMQDQRSSRNGSPLFL